MSRLCLRLGRTFFRRQLGHVALTVHNKDVVVFQRWDVAGRMVDSCGIEDGGNVNYMECNSCFASSCIYYTGGIWEPVTVESLYMRDEEG